MAFLGIVNNGQQQLLVTKIIGQAAFFDHKDLLLEHFSAIVLNWSMSIIIDQFKTM